VRSAVSVKQLLRGCVHGDLYGAPSGTKIVHAPQRDYLDRVTETRVWQTRLQIALRKLAFGKRVFRSRYGNSRSENASPNLHITWHFCPL